MKAFTDINQSKKLAEFLPIDSADMYYHNRVDIPDNFPLPIEWKHNSPLLSQEILAWSLAALLSVLPYPSLHKTFLGWRCDSYNKEGTTCKLGEDKNNPIDTCYEMIIMLHEQNLL